MHVYMNPEALGARAFLHQPRRYPRTEEAFLISAWFLTEKVQPIPSGDEQKQAGSGKAIESFWRCLIAEIWVFSLSIRASRSS